MPTEKETLYIAFSTQKGGAGKTTLTVLAASYLHYVKGLNVAVVDCKAYPVIEGTAENAVEKAEGLLEKLPGIDIVFFDLPGTVNSGGVLRTLANMDYIFSPIAADRVVMESTLRFAAKLKDTLIDPGKTNIKGLYLLWNMVDGREKSELYGVYEEIIRELGLQVLQTFLPDSKRFRRELTGEHKAVFRSTLFPVDNALAKGSHIREITEEILTIIGR